MAFVRRLSLVFACAALAAPSLAAQGRRPLVPTDVYRMRNVGDPQPSPEGDWVAYVVSRADSAANKSDADVWMTSWDGTRHVRLTSSPEGESRPRWSPDGRSLAFLSSRQGAKGAQVWLLDRAGGEAVKLTSLKGGVGDYAWSPDSKRFVFTILDDDPDEADTTKKALPKPIVTDRVHFKRDVEGYLGHRRTHLYLYDIASGKLDTLTRGDWDDERPQWSPDGTRILFRSNRRPDADRSTQDDLWVVAARAGAEPRRLVVEALDHVPGRAAWSPDGKLIAYTVGMDTGHTTYDQQRLAIIPADGGAPRVLTAALDRGVSQPSWTDDGQAVMLLVTDDREQYVARVDVRTGALTRVTRERNVVSQLVRGGAGRWVALASDPRTPGEVYALDNGALRRLTHHNDAFMATIELGAVEGFASKGKDGAETHSMLIRPPGQANAKGLPTVFFIHGGPKAQDGWDFDFTRQVIAARGLAVVAVNYRGSDGRGHAWQRAINADWGNKEVVDILGAADELVRQGVADPARLGIGGWSYGGILTDYVTASDARFKAAASGAGSALQLSMFGTDQYIAQYESELGSPWKNPQLWLKLSYPFFKADKIRTPTLYMSGEKDFNVPTAGTEQMYQALKVNGVEAELVVYPGQFHGITMPAFQVDRLTRYQRWFGSKLSPAVQP